MSIIKIEQDIELLENKLKEVDTIIADPIERNEYQKELNKKLKKLKRTKSQIEQQEVEQQELASLKSEFVSNSDKLFEIEESELYYDKQIEIKKKAEELTFAVASQSVSADSTSEPNDKSEIPWIKILIFIILGLILTTTVSIALIFSSNNARKVEAIRLKELARQEVIKSQAEAEKAKQERLKAEKEKQEAVVAKEDAERARQLAIQAQKKAEQAQEKADDLIKSNSYNKTSSRISPIEFIKKYYSNINNRNYNLTWQQFALQRRANPKSFQAYLSWWNSVQNTEIEQTKIIKQNNDRAIVYTELNYLMKTGTIYRNRKSKIYLTWDSKSKNWLIENHEQL